MALPIHFTEANFVLAAPAGYEDAVIPLPVRRQEDGKLISCWQLGPDEIAEIVRTGKIWLSVWAGLAHPPVFVNADKHAFLAPET